MADLRTVLVADDDAESRRLLARLLKQYGWQVAEVSTGEAALDFSKRNPPDLILLDLRMPGSVDGLRAVSLMRRDPTLQAVPVIAVSASPHEDVRRRALAAGCTVFLSKPLQLKELLHEIKLLTVPKEGLQPPASPSPDPPREVADAGPHKAPAASAALPRILIVDDVPENVRLLRSMLEPLGCELLSAANGQEALERVAAQPPDLILLDVVMPGLNGLTVLARLKADPRTRLIPVVMITALHGEREKLRAIESGADDFINKPFSKAELLARAKALLRLKRHTDELESAETTLFSLAQAVESRDPHTGDHCQRLARTSVRLGEHLQLPEDDLHALRRGGYLHDIGKVSVPDAILFKPGRLTEEEWSVMRRHTLVGEEICKPLHSLASVLPIIRSHHERWDGSGYPDRLKGEAIPLLARVLQLADIYDALRTRRPYKPPLNPAAALEQMQREGQAGLLDPNLLTVFVRAHDQIVGQ